MSADVFELILTGIVAVMLLWIFWWKEKSG